MSDSASTPATETSAPAPVDMSALLGGLSESERATWRLTGELPGASKSEDSTPPADSSPAEPVEQAASTDASLAPASETGKPAAAKGADARKAELGAEIQELLKQRAQLREEIARPAPRPETRPAASSPAPVVNAPANDPYPSEDDPRFAGDYGMVLEERAAWRARQEIRAYSDHQRRQQAEYVKTKQFSDNVEAAKTKYPDFEEKALRAPSVIPDGSLIDAWVLESPGGAEVLYHLQTHPADVARIHALPAVQQVRELAKLESSLAAPPVKTVTRAPAPGTSLGSKPAIETDTATAALQRGDFSAYRAEMNRREAASRK